MKTSLFAKTPMIRTLRWFFAVLGTYAVIGFVVAPMIVKKQLVDNLASVLKREVKIESLSINPFSLSARVRGFRIQESSGPESAVRFEELYINVSLASLYHRAPVLEEIRLIRPVIRIVRNEDKTYNFTDIIKKFTPTSDSASAASSSPRHFSLNNIRIVDGRIGFEDRPLKKQHAVTEIHLGIPFLSNLPYAADINVEPSFSAKVDNTPVSLKGETKPFTDTRETTANFEFKGLDLSRYADYSPVPLGFRLQRGTLDLRFTLSLTTHNNQLSTLVINNNFALGDLQLADQEGAALAGLDSLEAGCRFTLTQSGTVRGMVVSRTTVSLRGLRIDDASHRLPLAQVAEIALRDGEANLIERKIAIGRLTVDKGNIHLSRDRNGHFNFDHFISKKEPVSSGEKADTQMPWTARIQHLAVKETGISLDDSAHETPMKLTISDLDIEGDHLSTTPGAEGELRVNAVLGRKGHIGTTGALGLNPLKGNFEIVLRDIALTPFQGIIEENVNIIMTQGTAESRGRLTFSTGKSAPKVGFRGDIGLKGIVLLDKPTDQDLLKWKTLAVTGIDFENEPLKLRVKEISLIDFYSRLIVNPDATLNLQTLVLQNPSPPEPSDSAAASTPKPERNIGIRKIAFSRGHVNFSDFFVKPNYTVNLMNLSGTVSEMTSDIPGEMAFSGAIDGSAPIDISGRINPLSDDFFLDLHAKARDIEIPPLSPYAVKYAGYGIEKGKLSLELKYGVDHNKLSAENKIYLDQLTFGEKVESPTATKLPVLFAVSLLKDRNGVIDINLPISGSLDDPHFHLGRIIIQVIVNLIVKAVTSPFALLGAAFGSDEELAFVDFKPGSAVLLPESTKKLKMLAEALYNHPSLTMDIAGRVDIEKDREVLRRLSIERKIKAQKLKAMIRSGTPAGLIEDIVIKAEEYEKYLRAAYKAEKFPKPHNFFGFAKELPAPEMEQLMFDHVQIQDEDLRMLANQRAQVVKDWLVQEGQVLMERLFLISPILGREGLKDQESAVRSEFKLK